MLLSIIIPTYNSANYLLRCVKSTEIIKNYPVEIVIVDDGSTDDTAECVTAMIGCGYNIIYIYQNNNGPGYARNAGIKASSGKYITFIDADDTYDDKQLLKLLSSIEGINSEFDIICFGYRMIGVNGSEVDCLKYINSDFINPLGVYLKNGNIKDVVWNKIYKSKLVKNNDILFPKLNAREDSIFNIRAFSNARKLKLYDGVVYIHRSENINSLSANFSIKSMLEVCKSIELEYEAICSSVGHFEGVKKFNSRAFKVYMYAFIFFLQKEIFCDKAELDKNRENLLNLISNFDIGWRGKIMHWVTRISLASNLFLTLSSRISKIFVKFSH